MYGCMDVCMLVYVYVYTIYKRDYLYSKKGGKERGKGERTWYNITLSFIHPFIYK